ncbi:MAG: ABC transporter permease [Chloroflexota bacterium]
MKFLEFFGIALKSLLANKLRSSLTMLGIVIGVGAVIALMSIGRGAEASITDVYQSLGTNVLYVQPKNPDAPGLAAMSPGYAQPNLTLKDGDAIAKVPGVIAVAPTNENFVEVVYGDESAVAVIHGSTLNYLDVYNYSVAEGRFLTDRDVLRRDDVIVLGSKTAEELFGGADAVGKEVKIKGRRFTVIGVLEPKGGAFFGFSMDGVMVIPITTYQTKIYSQRTIQGDDAVQSIAVQLVNADIKDVAISDIEDILRKRHRIAPDENDDFSVISQEQALGLVQQVAGIFTVFLGALASISLLVGSIGIMNIMLVSVTERTREIGIRKAVGAKRRDILLQFLLEAATLSLAGGAIGIAIGWLLSYAVSLIDTEGTVIRAVVTPDIVILAISVSFIIGIVSGIYPAIRAARLNPIDALRYG